MREDPRWARIALLLNVVGTILLALSFQATSSDFRLVKADNLTVPGNGNNPSTTFRSVFALCTTDRTLIAEGTDSRGPALVLSAPGCPDSPNNRAAAVVNTEHPSFLYLGLMASGIGFFLQFLLVPRRRTLAEVNSELRILRKQKKLLELEIEQRS